MHTQHAVQRRDLAAIATAAALWGTSGPIGQLLAERSELAPLAVGFLRCALAALILAGLRGRAPLAALPRTADLWRLLAVGAGLAAYQGCYFAAVARAGVSVATLVTLGLAPVLVAVTSALAGSDRPDRRVLSALLVALAGLALLVGGDAPRGGDARMGSLLAAGSAAGYAGVTMVSRSLAGRVDSEDLTLAGFAIAAGLLGPLALGGGLALPASPSVWALLVYLGAVPTALAYRLFFAGLRTTRPTVASILTLIEPLTASVLAALLFGERLGRAGLLGGALLLAAVVVLARPARRDATRGGLRGG